MSRIDMILVPVDFEAPSMHALAQAMDMAEALGAKVHVIHAYQKPIGRFPDGEPVANAEIMSRLIQASHKALEEACAPYRDRKPILTTHLEEGDAREAILGTARAIHAGLIVMGTHGRKGISRMLIGSVAEAVLRASDVPVLTVH